MCSNSQTYHFLILHRNLSGDGGMIQVREVLMDPLQGGFVCKPGFVWPLNTAS